MVLHQKYPSSRRDAHGTNRGTLETAARCRTTQDPDHQPNYWEVQRILKTYRKRWTGTETFHRDGKQHLGMGDCQLRSGESQTRHMYLVFLAYSALMGQLRHDRAQEWAHARLTT